MGSLQGYQSKLLQVRRLRISTISLNIGSGLTQLLIRIPSVGRFTEKTFSLSEINSP